MKNYCIANCILGKMQFQNADDYLVENHLEHLTFLPEGTVEVDKAITDIEYNKWDRSMVIKVKIAENCVCVNCKLKHINTIMLEYKFSLDKYCRACGRRISIPYLQKFFDKTIAVYSWDYS